MNWKLPNRPNCLKHFDYDEGHKLLIGPTGVGKSNLMIGLALERMACRISQTIVLPHPGPLKTLVAELYARYRGSVVDRLKVEDVGDMRNVIMRPVVQYSVSDNDYEEELEDRAFEERALEPAISRQSESVLADTPAKEKSARLAVRLFQEAKRHGAKLTEGDIPDLLNRDNPIQSYALSFCRKPELIREFMLIKKLPMRDYVSMVESAIRFLEPVYRSPVVKARTSKPASFDWPAFFSNGGIHVITKGKASHEDFRTNCRGDFLLKYRMAMDGELPRHHYDIDEVNNYGLCDSFTARALSTARFRQFYVGLSVQLLDFADDATAENTLTNTTKFIFRQENPWMQESCARELRALMDRNAIHHYDDVSRQVHDGMDEVERRTTGRSTNHEGQVTTTESTSVQLVPRYREVMESRAVYEKPEEQVFWRARDLGDLPIGSCWVKPRGERPFLFHVPLVKPSFFPHVVERKVEECLSLIRGRAPYESPAPMRKTLQTGSGSAANGTNGHSSFSNFTRLPTHNSSKQGSTRPNKKRGNGRRGRSNGDR